MRRWFEGCAMIQVSSKLRQRSELGTICKDQPWFSAHLARTDTPFGVGQFLHLYSPYPTLFVGRKSKGRPLEHL